MGCHNLGPLLFLLYINDLHTAIIFFSPFHFANDINVSNKQNSVDKINKTLTNNKDLNKRTLFECKQNSFKCNKN